MSVTRFNRVDDFIHGVTRNTTSPEPDWSISETDSLIRLFDLFCRVGACDPAYACFDSLCHRITVLAPLLARPRRLLPLAFSASDIGLERNAVDHVR